VEHDRSVGKTEQCSKRGLQGVGLTDPLSAPATIWTDCHNPQSHASMRPGQAAPDHREQVNNEAIINELLQ